MSMEHAQRVPEIEREITETVSILNVGTTRRALSAERSITGRSLPFFFARVNSREKKRGCGVVISRTTPVSSHFGIKDTSRHETASLIRTLGCGSKERAGTFLKFNRKPSVIMLVATGSPNSSHRLLLEANSFSNLALSGSGPGVGAEAGLEKEDLTENLRCQRGEMPQKKIGEGYYSQHNQNHY